MTQRDLCSVVRIAIALAALKHKPKDQSTASYLLDLHSHFPLGTAKDADVREWRTYALDLEKQLAALKAQCDTDQELLSKLHTDVSQPSSTSDAPPPKKKSKKNTKEHNPEWSWDHNCADWSRVLSSQYPSSPSLVAAYASLQSVLTSTKADLVLYASRLADAVLRTLDTIHAFLFSQSSDSFVQIAFGVTAELQPGHIDNARIALASPLLVYVLRTALHTLVCAEQDYAKSKRQRRQATSTLTSIDTNILIDKVVDRLLERILLFLLRALVPLCSARLAPLLSPSFRSGKGKGKTSQSASKGKEKGKTKDKDKGTGSTSVDNRKESSDACTAVFALIGTSLEALDALPLFSSPVFGPGTRSNSIAGGVRDRLGLETIRELEQLYTVPLPSRPLSQPPATTSLEPPPSLSASLPTVHSRSQLGSQPHRSEQRVTTESRIQRLERLVGTREERIKALATRDAGWFLASTLNLCVAPALGESYDRPGTTGNSGGGFLREALLDRIGKLVRSISTSDGRGGLDGSSYCYQGTYETLREDHAHTSLTDPKFTIDPVCRNMLLAICERTFCQLAPSQAS